MTETERAWMCRRHGSTQIGQTPCASCEQEFRSRRPVAEMAIEERVAELGQWRGQLTIRFTDMHQRIEELCGRPVWTHEMARFDELIAEVREAKHVGLGDVLSKLPSAKRVLIAEVSGVQP